MVWRNAYPQFYGRKRLSRGALRCLRLFEALEWALRQPRTAARAWRGKLRSAFYPLRSRYKDGSPYRGLFPARSTPKRN